MCGAHVALALTNARTSDVRFLGVADCSRKERPRIFPCAPAFERQSARSLYRASARSSVNRMRASDPPNPRDPHLSLPRSQCAPQDVVTHGSKPLNDRLGNVSAGEEAHIYAGMGKALYSWARWRLRTRGRRECPPVCLARVIGEVFVLRLAGCEEFQNEFDGKAGPANYRFAT